MLKFIVLVIFVLVIVGACHLIAHAQMPPVTPPANLVIGRILVQSDLALYAQNAAAQAAAGNGVLGQSDAQFKNQQDAYRRLSDAFSRFRQLFPNTYKVVMQQCKCKLMSDTF